MDTTYTGHSGHPDRVLVLTDAAQVADELLERMVTRAIFGEVLFRLVVLNPARAEVHLLHPERHEKAAEAEAVLHETLPRLETALGVGRVIGSVSVRHDPMDAIEETLNAEPITEIMLHVREHALPRRLHQDLTHRLAPRGLPVTVVEHPGRTSPHPSRHP